MSSRTDSKWTTAIAVGITALCVVPLACFVRSTFVIPKTKVKDVPTTCKKEDGYDEIVTVYVVGGKSKAISPSPFTTKLVTYLRLTGIPHIIKEADFSRAPKGKAPYIEHAGATLGDTQLLSFRWSFAVSTWAVPSFRSFQPTLTRRTSSLGCCASSLRRGNILGHHLYALGRRYRTQWK